MKVKIKTIKDLLVETMDSTLEFKYNLDDEVVFFIGNKEYKLDSIQDNKVYGNDNKALILNLKVKK